MERIYHTWDKWECYPAGFYDDICRNGETAEEAELIYEELLSDTKEFSRVLSLVTAEWKNSCEHYLTNEKMNRIAWLGQAALAYKYNIPSKFRKGYYMLGREQRLRADRTALKALNKWLLRQGERPVSLSEAGINSQVNLY